MRIEWLHFIDYILVLRPPSRSHIVVPLFPCPSRISARARVTVFTAS